MKRIDQLEGLRGLLAVWVVIVHLLPAAGIEPQGFGPFKILFDEKIRVQVFCIMSGFVIFMMMSARQEPYPLYIKRRLLRIYPAYALAFVLSFAMAAISYQALADADFDSAHNLGRMTILDQSFLNWPWHILTHATLLHGLIPESWLPLGSYAFLGQGWNVSTEFQFYLIAPAVFFFLHQPLRWLRVLFVASALAVWWKLRYYPNGSFISYYGIYFLTGIASYYLWNIRFTNRRLFNPWTVVAATLAMGFFNLAIAGWIFIFGFAVLVRDQQRAKDPVTRFFELPAMMFFGTISYSLYLLHMVPLYFWMYMLNGQGLSQPLYFCMLTTLTFATAIPLAMLSQKYVEQAFYASKTHKLPQALNTSPNDRPTTARHYPDAVPENRSRSS